MTYFCNDCKEHFYDFEIETKEIYPQTMDSPAEYESYCPYCGSVDFDEAKICAYCGEPFSPEAKGEFCEECITFLTDQFNRFTRKLAVDGGLKPSTARDTFLEFIAERY